MQIIGFNFEKIQAERKSPLKGKLELSTNISVKSISQEKIDLIKEQTPLKFNFEFKIIYKPNIAEISLEGFAVGLFDKTKAKEILKKWKSKKIADDVRVPLFNLFLTKSNLKALQLEEELSLPTHVPLPKIKPAKQNNANYTG